VCTLTWCFARSFAVNAETCTASWPMGPAMVTISLFALGGREIIACDHHSNK
jgi:hypothetical protein